MPRPRKFDERLVLDQARDQFWAMGYAGTRMDDIAEKTGLGKGSLYGAFGGKSTLFHRVFDDYCQAIVERTGSRLAGPDEEAFARLSTYVQLIAANTAADTEHRGCLLAKGAAELAEHDPVVAERSAGAMNALLAHLQTDVAACQRNGDIDEAADPAQLAALLLAVLRGTEAVGKAGLSEDILKGIAQTAISVLPRGHKPDPGAAPGRTSPADPPKGSAGPLGETNQAGQTLGALTVADDLPAQPRPIRGLADQFDENVAPAVVAEHGGDGVGERGDESGNDGG